MDELQKPVAIPEAGSSETMTFDDYLKQLPSSRQTAHKILGPLILVGMVLVVGAFIYGLYASFRWKVVGEEQVVVAWMIFVIATGLVAVFFGLDTVNLGATLPLPGSRGAGSQFETGRGAVQTGWVLLVGGLLLGILAAIGIVSARAGIFTLENWIQVIVGLAVFTGLLGILQGVLKSIRSRE